MPFDITNWYNGLSPTARGALLGGSVGAGGLGLMSLLASKEENRKKNFLKSLLLGGAGGAALGALVNGQSGSRPTLPSNTDQAPPTVLQQILSNFGNGADAVASVAAHTVPVSPVAGAAGGSLLGGLLGRMRAVDSTRRSLRNTLAEQQIRSMQSRARPGTGLRNMLDIILRRTNANSAIYPNNWYEQLSTSPSMRGLRNIAHSVDRSVSRNPALATAARAGARGGLLPGALLGAAGGYLAGPRGTVSDLTRRYPVDTQLPLDMAGDAIRAIPRPTPPPAAAPGASAAGGMAGAAAGL